MGKNDDSTATSTDLVTITLPRSLCHQLELAADDVEVASSGRGAELAGLFAALMQKARTEGAVQLSAVKVTEPDNDRDDEAWAAYGSAIVESVRHALKR